MADLNTYSPKDVIISIAGLHTVQGYADGTFVRVTKEMKPFTKVRAMDGEQSRMYSDDDGYKVELTIMQSSSTNNILSMLYNIDTATRIGKFPLFIKDSLGQSSFMAGTAWIEEIPQLTFGNGMETRTWVFGCSDAIITFGGNDSTSLVEDALLVSSATLPLLREYGVF
jgi:hypothetical protein